MSLPKVQHVVPKSYLKRFANQRKGGYFVYCYDKKTGGQFDTNIRNVASEKGFYDLQADSAAVLTLEPGLCQVEGSFCKVLDELLACGSLDCVNTKSRVAIAQFVALQMLRTPAHRKSYEQVNHFLSTRASETAGDTTENGGRAQHLLFLANDLAPFAVILAAMKWTLCHNGTNTPLWTSDNPVWRCNPNPPPGPMFSNLGLACKGIEVHFPLSPEHLLVMSGDGTFGSPSSYCEMDDQNVLFYNCGQVIHSTRYLISPNEDFEMAGRYLAEYPEYRNTDRALIRVMR